MNRLVAHRGDMTTYPENSVLALNNAAILGFQYLELDIQLSKDLIPIVIHDSDLKRTAGVDKKVWELTSDEIESTPLLCPDNLAKERELLFVPSFSQVIEHINQFSKLNVFIEIKKESVEQFGLETVVNQILAVQEKAKFNVIIISFLSSVIEYIKHIVPMPTGYVLKKYSKKYLSKTKDIQPDYLFCNIKKINRPNELWNGPWKWTLYDIKNPIFAYELLEQGVDLIETGDIVRLSNSEYFK